MIVTIGCLDMTTSIWYKEEQNPAAIIPSQTLLPYPNPGDFFPSLQNERNVKMEISSTKY